MDRAQLLLMIGMTLVVATTVLTGCCHGRHQFGYKHGHQVDWIGFWSWCHHYHSFQHCQSLKGALGPVHSLTHFSIFPSIPGFPPMQKQVNHTLPSYSQYNSTLTILWAIYGSVYDQPGTINLYGPEYGQPGAIKRKLG